MIRFLLIPIVLFLAPSTILGIQTAGVWAQTPEPAESPATEGPETDNSEAENSEAENPEVDSPETQSPEADNSEAEPEAESESPDIAEPVVPDEYQVVTGDRWSFAVPPDWQNVLSAPAELENDTSVVAQLNDSQKQIVVNLVVQSYEGESSDYLQQSIDSLSDLGVTIHTQEPIALPEVEGVDLDVSLDSSEPPTRILQRIVADDGTGYALACGGKEEEFEAARSICTTIINSLQVTPR